MIKEVLGGRSIQLEISLYFVCISKLKRAW